MRLLFVLLLSGVSIKAEARTRVGLALSGGGARGIAHIGVLRALEKLHVPIDAIAGTSIGALVGALYAAGYTPDEIEEIFLTTDWENIIFKDRVERRDLPFHRKIDFERYLFDFEIGFREGEFLLPPSLVHSQKFSELLNRLFLRVADRDDFSKLGISFVAVASDIETGKTKVIDHGHLPDAIRASSAYPGLFSPVEIDGVLLLDGGSSTNLPVDIARQMNVDRVIAVDISSPLNERQELASFLDFSDQFVSLMIRRTTDEQLKKADVKILPKIHNMGTFGKYDFKSIIQGGESEALKLESELKIWQLPADVYAKNRERQRQLTFRYKEEDVREIENQVRQQYRLGYFERVDYRVDAKNANAPFEIRQFDKSWGPNYLHFGATWDGEIKGKRDGNALVNFRMTRLNHLEAEWRTGIQAGTALELNSEFYQPLESRGLFFIAPQFTALRTNQQFYSNRSRLAEYEVDAVAGQVDLGVQFGSYGELRAGLRKGFTTTEYSLGAPVIFSSTTETGSWIYQFRLDQLDSVYFPSKGVYLSATYLRSAKILGAERRYKKAYSQAHGFYSLGRLTAFLGIGGGTNFGSEIPVYDQFVLGGFRSLAGFREEELRGQTVAWARSGLLCKLPISANVFFSRVYLGSWGEAGNVWESKEEFDRHRILYAGTGAMGFDTKLGALFLAYGQSGVHNRQFYVSVGRPFGIKSPRIF